LAALGNNRLNYSTASSPTRSTYDPNLYKKLKEGGYNYEQTRQILLARQKQMQDRRINSKGKYSPNKKSTRDLNQLSRMVHSNSRYLSVPHGGAS